MPGEEKKVQEEDLTSPTGQQAPTNSRGIPNAEFVEDVVEYSTRYEKHPEQILKEFNSQYGKYKYMEHTLTGQKRQYVTKIPEIQGALAALKHLIKKKEAGEEIKTTFELADAVHAQAVIKDQDSVCLWLGANVMLEYPFDEAEALLTKNMESAQYQLKVTNNDLAFLKDQITISEVNIARMHNYNVQLRAEAKAADVAKSGGAKQVAN
jgi:prefoldin subunit 5